MTQALMEKIRQESLARGKDGRPPAIGRVGGNHSEFIGTFVVTVGQVMCQIVKKGVPCF